MAHSDQRFHGVVYGNDVIPLESLREQTYSVGINGIVFSYQIDDSCSQILSSIMAQINGAFLRLDVLCGQQDEY
jgi:hypothetical protein